MTSISVRISLSDWTTLNEALFTPDGNENAAALLCGISETATERRLLVRRVVPVPPDLYTERLTYHLEVAPSFYNGIVTECLNYRYTPIIVHSHPGHRDAWYSGSDDHGERRLLPILASLLPGVLPASLVVTPSSATGRVIVKEKFVALSGLTVVGPRVHDYEFSASVQRKTDLSGQFDRQVRAFGVEGQQKLEALRVAIVGVGGTGSIVGEQLVRAGVRDIVLIDSDKIEESNLSRVFGATKHDINQHKARAVAEHLKSISENLSVKPDTHSAIRQQVLLTLRDRDILFLCVDNDRTRAILNRFAHQYIIPVIDHGTRLDARKGQISAAAGRVSVIGADLVCLRCSNHLSSERIRAESMSIEERGRLAQEGYVMGIDEPAPAVVSINTTVAGLGVTSGLNLFVGLTGGVQPLDQIYDARSGSVFAVGDRHEVGCDVCDPGEGVKGLGDLQIVSAYD